AQKEMIAPSLMAIIVPIVIGLLLGPSGIMGLLVGGLSTGFAVAIMMANAGGSWDNAKKYVESGQFGGKGSDCHKATVVGDTVGDPFKDTSGPSLNILIKLMSMVAVVVAGLTVSYSPEIQYVLGFNPTERRFKEEARIAYKEGTLKLPDPTTGGIASGSVGMLDEDDPLMGSDDTILPEDEEGLLGDDLATDTVIQDKPGTGAVQPPATEPKPTTPAPTTGGFGGFDEPAKPAEKPAAAPDASGFGGFDDSAKPATPASEAAPAAAPVAAPTPAVLPAAAPSAASATTAPAPETKPAAAVPAAAGAATASPAKAVGGFDDM
ncbi:MAG TPA: sodium/proton-translocating pyrophosphatase, partial [Candidatus Ozemobacteraceae bacterium]|nr:sodium/proton-translocating pyrophosphatase [Candidatus Ozemobacteraceae bacterium]